MQIHYQGNNFSKHHSGDSDEQFWFISNPVTFKWELLLKDDDRIGELEELLNSASNHDGEH